MKFNGSVIQSFFHQSLKRTSKINKYAHTHKQDTLKRLIHQSVLKRLSLDHQLSIRCQEYAA
jgi:hypothetical protein